MKPVWILSASLLLCVGCDQATKVAAQRYLSTEPTSSYLADTVRLTYLQNRGAFLSLGADWPDWARLLMFTVVSMIMVVAALVFVGQRLRTDKEFKWWSPAAAATLLAAGGIGNLIDRFIRDGAVIDFMNLGIGPVRTGVFNVADVHIMAALAMFFFVKDPKQESKAQPQAATEPKPEPKPKATESTQDDANAPPS
jgi:signal peptidase II